MEKSGRKYYSLFQALGQWGRLKKRVRDERDLVKKLGRARGGEPVNIVTVLKTSFHPPLKR